MHALLVALALSGLPAGQVVKINQARTESTFTESTGTVIAFLEDGDGLILTCAHGHDPGKPCQVLAQRKVLREGKFLAIDKTLDVALVKAPVGKGFKPIEMADETPESGECLVVGFGDHKYLERRTNIKGLLKGGAFLEVESPGRPGDSGGPVLVDGKIVAMHLRGQDGLKGDGYSRPIGKIREWVIAHKIAKLNKTPAVRSVP